MAAAPADEQWESPPRSQGRTINASVTFHSLSRRKSAAILLVLFLVIAFSLTGETQRNRYWYQQGFVTSKRLEKDGQHYETRIERTPFDAIFRSINATISSYVSKNVTTTNASTESVTSLPLVSDREVGKPESVASKSGVLDNTTNISGESDSSIPTDESQNQYATSLGRVESNVLPDVKKSAYKLLLTNQSTNKIGVSLQTKGVLDLLPWELQSITEYKNVTNSKGETKLFGECRKPKGVTDYCCPGSYSEGGGISSRHKAHNCFKGMDVYQRVADVVLQDLERTNAMVDDVCDVCRIVDIVQKHTLRLAFSGDSVMAQNVDGFTCELARRGYNVTLINDHVVDFEALFGLKNIFTHEISGPEHWQKPITFDFLFQYKLQPGNNVSELEWIVTSYDVLVMNFGVHFPEEDFYGETLARLFNVTRQGNVTLLAHRETTAQHFKNAGGEWSDETTFAGCVPHNDSDSAILGWRDRFFREKAMEFGYNVVVADANLRTNTLGTDNELVILPFFNVTSAVYDLHPDECTHFCSTPYLWMPVWRGLRLAMDRKWRPTTSA